MGLHRNRLLLESRRCRCGEFAPRVGSSPHRTGANMERVGATRRSEEHLHTEVEQLRSKLEKAQRDLEQALSASTESKAVQERCKIDTEKAHEALKLKDDEIAFLRGHVSQLTQSISQLSLKP